MIWALFRLMSYTIVVINLLSCGTFLYIIAPYTSYFFFDDLRFWKYLKYYHKYYFYSAAYIWGTAKPGAGIDKNGFTSDLASNGSPRPNHLPYLQTVDSA
ncbi:hypothetical protein [Desulfovibrio gilichinskyi]|uniref:Uncharacterized protein n=1 Tax=Desulfovibrio gilichinskyi TaxID=1519643 RepID=A0A1X7DFM9_9BACT|nr:hypothetical protein [Desulfovibrio gilichinskyi]SMF14559.1 hypothetical protein SAMN06295933_1831 [Desulfovibrio gilichinskyi]